MSFARLNRPRKTIGFRLTAWYMILYTVSSLITFGILYFFLSSSVREREREVVQAELMEFLSFYTQEGVVGLKKQSDLERKAHGHNSIFVRLSTKEKETLFLNLPDRWTHFGIDYFKAKGIDEAHSYLRLQAPNDKENLLEIASLTTPNGLLLQVGRSTRGTEELLEHFRMIFLGILIPVVALGFCGGVFLTSRTLLPIKNLIHTVRSIERGEIGARVSEGHAQDELYELIVVFNRMLERIETLICGMKACLDNVAHDLRTPVTRLRITAEMALQSDQSNSEALREALMDCVEESERMGAMLNALMDISEAEAGVMQLNLEQTDIGPILKDVMELYGIIAEDKNISLHMVDSGPLVLIADRNRMRQVFANLVDNAVKYTPSGGRVDIEAHHEKDCIEVIVRDTGAGIPPEEISRIWDRLYRGDKSRSQRGLGLGLSLVRAVVHAHKGKVEVLSEPGRGSRFIVLLPLHLNSLL